MQTRIILGALVIATIAASAMSYGTGALPGLVGWIGVVNPMVTRSLSATNGACGECHNVFPGGGPTPLRVHVGLSRRVLQPQEPITVTAWSQGGQVSLPPLVDIGGFCMDATAGVFTPGSNSQVDPAGTAITHQLASTSNGRRWVFGYTAPTTPGLVELFCVVNTADGDGQPTGDVWAFHGSNPFSPFSTPVRLYVLAPGVAALGSPCPDGQGNWPVLGARQAPAVGNAAFALELHGAAPAGLVFFLLSVNSSGFVPFDLGIFGIAGCQAQVEQPVVVTGVASPGMAALSEGTATLAWPLPASVALRGVTAQAQAAFLDPAASTQGRAVPLTFSNGLAITVQ